MASFLDMFSVALMPVLKVLLMTAAGLFLALDSIDILGDTSRHHLNRIVFYCFNPALVAVSFAKTVTFQSFITLWFMPVNIFLTYLIGTVLGWVLGKVIKAPNHIKCLMLASCASGNFLALPIIIIPAMCQLKGGPFGTPDVCAPHAQVYASLSMAIGVTYFWSYVYNMVRIYPKDTVPENLDVVSSSNTVEGKAEETLVNVKDLELLSRMNSTLVTPVDELSDSSSNKADEETPANDAQCLPSANQSKELSEPCHFMMTLACMLKRCLRDASKKMNLKKAMAPSTIAGIIGILIGMIWPIKYVLIGDSAPLRVISNTSSMIGDAAIPCTALILGANLLKGLRGCKVQHTVIIGIIAVRYILLPLIGILIVKGAVHLGFVEPHNPLLHFSLMIHYALPPAMNLGTVTQLFGIGQRECSVIMLWTYAVAAVAVTLWCTLFSWLVAF
ncbi:protein PIN-LIKES 3-like [Silene latifolia]|uniref:protein PIN-LIKES 3-like n=1 Tax=Silene latifolia TaxID=37657 RepID=UPI003D770974